MLQISVPWTLQMIPAKENTMLLQNNGMGPHDIEIFANQNQLWWAKVRLSVLLF